jgi:hypothetical protein
MIFALYDTEFWRVFINSLMVLLSTITGMLIYHYYSRQTKDTKYIPNAINHLYDKYMSANNDDKKLWRLFGWVSAFLLVMVLVYVYWYFNVNIVMICKYYSGANRWVDPDLFECRPFRGKLSFFNWVFKLYRERLTLYESFEKEETFEKLEAFKS